MLKERHTHYEWGSLSGGYFLLVFTFIALVGHNSVNLCLVFG